MRKIASGTNIWFTPESWLTRIFAGRSKQDRLGVLRIRLGRSQWAVECSEAAWMRQSDIQQRIPVHLLYNAERGEDLWWYQGLFYWEETRLTPQQFQALLERKHSRKRQQAITAINVRDLGKFQGRQAIPDELKSFVYERDGGRCVRCGSATELQFDHIIPVAKGGATTAQNLQLLCGPCNRSKGANVV